MLEQLVCQFDKVFRSHSRDFEDHVVSADDLYQDACVVLLEFLQTAKVTPGTQDFVHLFRVHLRNRMINGVKFRKVRNRGEVYGLEPDWTASDSTTVEELLGTKEFFARLDQALEGNSQKLLRLLLDPELHDQYPYSKNGVMGPMRECSMMRELECGRFAAREARDELLRVGGIILDGGAPGRCL